MRDSVASRLSWEDAHRLEVNLRARALRLTGSTPVCPGCGNPVTDIDDQMRLAGVVLHPRCLCLCGPDAAA